MNFYRFRKVSFGQNYTTITCQYCSEDIPNVPSSNKCNATTIPTVTIQITNTIKVKVFKEKNVCRWQGSNPGLGHIVDFELDSPPCVFSCTANHIL